MYRVVEIQFKPQSSAQWSIHADVRTEAARLWFRMCRIHAWCRKHGKPWPNRKQFEQWAKKKFPLLHSQSVQQTIDEFLEAVKSTRQKRQNGDLKAQYPWKQERFRQTTFTNQAVKINWNRLILPCGKKDGKRRYLYVPLPSTFRFIGRLVEARLEFCKLALVFDVAEMSQPANAENTLGIDLGVNTLIAATDGTSVVQVSGREVKSLVRNRNKILGEISSKQTTKVKGSNRWRRLQRRKRQMLAAHKRRIRDIAHKATRIVAEAFPGAKAFVGKPFNDAATKLRPRNAQSVSQAINGKIIQYLSYKLAGGAEQIEEHYTSQTCPVCRTRSKHGRIFICRNCGLVAPRDAVGSINIRSKGIYGQIQTIKPEEMPRAIKYRRPLLRSRRRRSGGHPASCSIQETRQNLAA
jgi:putative transposase